MSQKQEPMIFDNPIFGENRKSDNNKPQPNLLIVDDEWQTVDELSELLTEEGYLIETATDARTALNVLAKNPNIDLIIVDIRMPGMDGLEMLRCARSIVPNGRSLSAIVLTGQVAVHQEEVSAINIGTLEFIAKPISAEILLDTVRRVKNVLKEQREKYYFDKYLEKKELRNAHLGYK
ncbi:MAG: response regulator [Alphaproteobacteria bacterium]|nr:response regulator [Alphaproteobacteria bacterium]